MEDERIEAEAIVAFCFAHASFNEDRAVSANLVRDCTDILDLIVQVR